MRREHARDDRAVPPASKSGLRIIGQATVTPALLDGLPPHDGCPRLRGDGRRDELSSRLPTAPGRRRVISSGVNVEKQSAMVARDPRIGLVEGPYCHPFMKSARLESLAEFHRGISRRLSHETEGETESRPRPGS